MRPLGDLYEVIAGARRVRAARLAELEDVPVCIRELSDDQALEVQIVENSQREDVHPYEEAAGYEALLQRPGYDVAALAAKCGKSESHVYSRLSLLSLIPEAIEAFQQERITATHANLLARLTPEQQEKAFPQCWTKFFHGGEAQLVAARHLSAWIRENLYLPLSKAPFNREDAALLPQAGSCPDCPKRTGFNRALFCDFQEDEQCLDPGCYQAKIEAHITRELGADAQLLRIEAGWRPATERYPGAVKMNELWPLKHDSPQCESIERGIIVDGNGIGSVLSICTYKACPVHNQQIAQAVAARARGEAEDEQRRAREEEAARNAPRPTEEELRDAREQEEAEAEDRERTRQETEAAERRRSEEIEAFNRENRERLEAERKRMEEEEKRRAAKLKRIAKHAPESLNAAQLRILLRALIESDFEVALSLMAQEVVKEEDDDRRDAEEVLAAAVKGLPDKQVAGFAVRLALGGYLETPDPTEIDYLAEAEKVFLVKPASTATKKATA